MGPMGVTLDATSTTFTWMFATAIVSIPVLFYFARRSANTDFKRGAVYLIFTYMFTSTFILLITQINGLINAMGWSIIILHIVFVLWAGYYNVSPEMV